MAKYVKLGREASVFSDSSTGLKVLPGQVVKLTPAQEGSSKIKSALKGGHLTWADSSEHSKAEETPKKTLPQKGKKPTKDEILEAIKGEYELDDEELEKLSKMTKKELEDYQAYLENGEEDEDDEEEEDVKE